MELDSEFITTVIGSALVGYCGGWLFRGDSELRGRYGFIVAFILVYIAFFAQLAALTVVGGQQNWFFTGAYASGFIYRFFIKHG